VHTNRSDIDIEIDIHIDLHLRHKDIRH